MDIKDKLLKYGKKNITVNELASLMQVDCFDVHRLFDEVSILTYSGYIEPVKASGKNGNIAYPLYKKYRILLEKETFEDRTTRIMRLHPLLLKNGYLLSHKDIFDENEQLILKLNSFLFTRENAQYVSRKERSFEIFGREKILDDSSFKALLKALKIGEGELKFYDTPEYCFHDFIPVRKEQMTLLICENKDIWFNIRRRMFEDGFRSLFGTDIDGVVYGCGNKVSQKKGALIEYVRFMGNPDVRFLYWGDIDREGFDIFRRTVEVNKPLNISLFVPGYLRMLSRSRGMELEDSPSLKKKDMDFGDILEAFDGEDAEALDEILKSNKLIPQEIISYVNLCEE